MKKFKTKHPLYRVWHTMKQQCDNPNDRTYKYYGGNGVTVCKEWRDFWVFVEDMIEKPYRHVFSLNDGAKEFSKETSFWKGRSSHRETPVRSHYLYHTWRGMKERCDNPNHNRYDIYGGKGVNVCNQWDDFWKFYEDMGDRPEGHSLDRISCDGNYCPENCRWATYSEQNLNKGSAGKYIKGVSKHVSGKFEAGISKNRKRVYLGLYNTEMEAFEVYKKAYIELHGKPPKV